MVNRDVGNGQVSRARFIATVSCRFRH